MICDLEEFMDLSVCERFEWGVGGGMTIGGLKEMAITLPRQIK